MDALNSLHYSEFVDIERSLSRILMSFQRHSRYADSVVLSSSEFSALSKFHYILSSELYG